MTRRGQVGQGVIVYPTTDEKRELIKNQLETSFPTITTYLYSLLFIGVGLAGIGLHIGLIVNQGLHYEIGNGIWGGLFAVINGLIKLNLGKH